MVLESAPTEDPSSTHSISEGSKPYRRKRRKDMQIAKQTEQKREKGSWKTHRGPAHMTGHSCGVQNSVTVPYSMLSWLKKLIAGPTKKKSSSQTLAQLAEQKERVDRRERWGKRTVDS